MSISFKPPSLTTYVSDLTHTSPTAGHAKASLVVTHSGAYVVTSSPSSWEQLELIQYKDRAFELLWAVR